MCPAQREVNEANRVGATNKRWIAKKIFGGASIVQYHTQRFLCASALFGAFGCETKKRFLARD
jgi:hypothetical protein